MPPTSELYLATLQKLLLAALPSPEVIAADGARHLISLEYKEAEIALKKSREAEAIRAEILTGFQTLGAILSESAVDREGNPIDIPVADLMRALAGSESLPQDTAEVHHNTIPDKESEKNSDRTLMALITLLKNKSQLSGSNPDEMLKFSHTKAEVIAQFATQTNTTTAVARNRLSATIVYYLKRMSDTGRTTVKEACGVLMSLPLDKRASTVWKQVYAQSSDPYGNLTIEEFSRKVLNRKDPKNANPEKSPKKSRPVEQVKPSVFDLFTPDTERALAAALVNTQAGILKNLEQKEFKSQLITDAIKGGDGFTETIRISGIKAGNGSQQIGVQASKADNTRLRIFKIITSMIEDPSPWKERVSSSAYEAWKFMLALISASSSPIDSTELLDVLFPKITVELDASGMVRTVI